MENRTKGIALIVIAFIFYFFIDAFSSMIPKNINYLLWFVWTVLVAYSIYWLGKNKDFLKKHDTAESSAKHRMDVLEEMGFYEVMISIGYALGFIALGVGVYALLSTNPDKMKFFIAMLVLGLASFIGSFFLSRWRKR